MIDKKISVSEQVTNLPIPGQLLYTWGMPHSDDLGILPHSHKTLKALIVPMWDMTLEDFGKLVEDIVSQKLWEEYEYKGQRFYRIKNFTRYQTLKRDRQPQTLLPIEFSKDPKDTWSELEKLGFQLEDSGFQLDTEEKGREGKRREVKRSKGKIDYTSDFEKFWEIYPKKTGKAKAFDYWQELETADKKKIMEDIPKRMADDKWVNGFIKDPERYIKNRQWEDDIIKPRGKVEPQRKVDSFKK